MLLHTERDKYFSSLLCSIFEGLNSFFFSKAQKKYAHSLMALELKPRMGKFSLLS